MFIPLFSLCVLGGLLILAAGIVFNRMRRIQLGAATFRAIAEGASDGLVLMKQDSRIVWVNQAYCDIMRRRREDMLGCYPLEFALPPEDALSKEEIRAFRFDPKQERFGKLTQVDNLRANGERFVHEFSHAVVFDGRNTRFLLSGRDITERLAREKALIAAQKRLEKLSQEDPLTGLANRASLRTSLEKIMDTGGGFAVLQIDMNDFKNINDTFGHHAGDAILVHFSKLLRDVAQDDWVVARVGGDEFTVLLPSVTKLESALNVGRRLFDIALTPMEWNSGELSVSISVGAAVSDGRCLTVDEVLNRSDVALYDAKMISGLRVRGYDDARHQTYVETQNMQSDTARAVAEKAIGFHFQPVVDVRLGKVLRYEMLARWEHETKGMLGPAHILPHVEQLGLIEEFDKHVLDSAIAAIQTLDRTGQTEQGVSINLSAAAMHNDTISDHLIWLIEQNSVDPARIAIEILETTAVSLSQGDTVSRQISRFVGAGHRLLLDDFGMGYAGLAHLTALDIHGLKIDRQLVSKVDIDVDTKHVVAATIDLARKLNIEVIAEGAETLDQIQTIFDIGGDMVQGYGVAHPMPLEDSIEWTKGEWPRWLSAFANSRKTA